MFKIFIIICLILIFVPAVRRFIFWLVVGKKITKEFNRFNNQREKQAPTAQPTNKKQDTGHYIDFEEVK